MTRAILLRKINPPAVSRVPQSRSTLDGGNDWQSDASEKENVRIAGETEERIYEKVECGGKSCAGGRLGDAPGGGAGCGKAKRAAQGGGESDASGAGTMERHRAQIDRHGGGLPRG